MANTGSSAAGNARHAEANGAVSGSWSKQAPKKGLAGIFAAIFGQALSGSKTVAQGAAKAEQGTEAAQSAKTLLDMKELTAGQKSGPAKASPNPAGPQIPDVKSVAANAARQGPVAVALAKRDASAKEIPAEDDSGAGGKSLPAALRRKEQGPDHLQDATAQSALLQPSLLPTQEPKNGRGAEQQKSATKALDDESLKKKRLDDPGLAARIQIFDQRKSAMKTGLKAEGEKTATEGVATDSRPSHGEASKTDREILIDLSKSSPLPPADKGGPAREAAATGQNFAALLADRLRDSGNTEIVQSARIILKDGDSGSIRMRLNPPELGNVKIELYLADNSISGRIVVESDAARNAFEKGMASLQDAFRSGGFESAKLEVQVGSGNAQGQGAWNGGGRGGEGPPGPFWSERSRSAAFEPSSAAMASRSPRSGRAVDIVV
ncbi:MAG TPA: flagellar hook-length control protein FliK [Rectinemataceae bacterium]|nr:flagellar hook-length control protein FliK [Rectinemataceae bacterium]